MKSGDGINSQLSITRSDRHDSGPYKCIAENLYGKSEHTIYLAVQGNLSFMHACIGMRVYALVVCRLFYCVLHIYIC